MESQNGYPVIDTLAECKYYDIDTQAGVRLPLSPGDEGWLLAYFTRRFDKYVEPLDRTDTHGYNKRKVGGSTDWSNHASGTAVDCNATKHVQGKRGTFTDAQVATIRKIQGEFDNVIKWGGDFRTTPDEMHFEVIGGPEDVDLIVRVLKRYGKVNVDRVVSGKRNLDVYLVKRALRLKNYEVGTYNFYFGVGLERALKKFQSENGLPASGKATRETIEYLDLKPV